VPNREPLTEYEINCHITEIDHLVGRSYADSSVRSAMVRTYLMKMRNMRQNSLAKMHAGTLLDRSHNG